MRIRQNRAWILIAVAATLLLTSCEGIAYVDLKASGYSITRYESWAPVTLKNVRNPSDHILSQVVITARCKEAPYKYLEQFYESAPFAIGPFETVAAVSLPQVDGYPYFTSGPVGCSFDASNRLWPAELEVTITLD
ncbi:MAG TPA: hypothetical protein PLT07_07400 [Trueperaceae bacterium]|nr:hypothetical protein [Trueperaceae bacterium]